MRGMPIVKTTSLPCCARLLCHYAAESLVHRKLLCSTVFYVIDTQERFVSNKRHRSIPRSLRVRPNLADTATVNWVDMEPCFRALHCSRLADASTLLPVRSTVVAAPRN